jgi:hypothetical protein
VSTIVQVLSMGVDGGHPRLLVRCRCCKREYVTTAAKANVRKLRRCAVCRPPRGHAVARGGRRRTWDRGDRSEEYARRLRLRHEARGVKLETLCEKDTSQ